MRLELTREGLLVLLANHYTTQGAYEKVVYQANIFPLEIDNEKKIYIEISTGNLKKRFYNIDIPLLICYLENKQPYPGFANLKEGRVTPQIK